MRASVSALCDLPCQIRGQGRAGQGRQVYNADVRVIRSWYAMRENTEMTTRLLAGVTDSSNVWCEPKTHPAEEPSQG